MRDEGRTYYPKRVGWRWEIWWKWDEDHKDPSGATEWRAVWGIKFWRWWTAFRLAHDLWQAYRDGQWSMVEPEDVAADGD